jgi:hypothetical protein
MKCLIRILNVFRLDKIRNEIIRQRIGVTPVLDYIKKQQLKWYGHVSRSPPNGIIVKAHIGVKLYQCDVFGLNLVTNDTLKNAHEVTYWRDTLQM